MMKFLTMFCVTATLFLFSMAGQATTIKAGYSVGVNGEDPGLAIEYHESTDNPFQFDLGVNDSRHVKLFRIWTDETSVNDDDKNSKDITVDFSFIMPPASGDAVEGQTFGFVGSFWGFPVDQGKVTWTKPGDFYFGPNHDGHIQIALSDATFTLNKLGFGGYLLGADVWATITLTQDATAAVPEPGILALFGFGLLGLGVTARRRRRSA